jgi:eukaryotic-like serine/threonine-protein kinase
MTISVGTRLGPYEVLAPIGAGGMGEVYHARDERLKRDVAIKVLPASYSQDADRLRRFEQEAQAAGALNHPNITAIYDLGAHDGAPYIVTELLEGETLRGRLAGGALAVRKAIEYALQIARGLAAAHEKGIIHRDLKPENLFVTKDGRVKILDFGLAKLTEVEGSGRQQTNLPTATAGTEAGVVMGTLGYMSPEQVKGHPADQRSDLFSFGAILYEMLSGSRAFHRDSAAETISAILREEPPDLSATNRSVQPGLERIVRHCLEKNPEERFYSARDLAFDLEALSGESTSSSRAASIPAASIARRRVSMPVVAVAALAALVAGALGGRLLLRKSAEPPRYTRLSFRRGLVQTARFAPDGETIIYGAAWEGAPFEVFTTRAGRRESRSLGFGPADILSVSGSGQLAISLSRRFTSGWESSGTLAQVSLEGGAPREVLENVQEADWAPDGKTLMVVREVGGRSRLEFPIGKVLYEAPGWISLARLSRRGDRIAFVDHPQRGDNVGSLCTLDLAGKKTVLTARSVHGLAWSPDGSEVWASSGGTLLAVSRPEATRVLTRVPGGTWLLDVSRAGRVLLAHTNIRREIVGLPPGQIKEHNLSWFDWSFPDDLSNDGQTVLFDESNRQSEAGYEIYLRKTEGSAAVLLGEGHGTALSPDGRWALSVFRPFGQAQLVLLPTGAGQPHPLSGDALLWGQWGAWMPDGKGILFAASEAGHAPRLWVREIEGGRARPITPEGIRSYFNGNAISPDGKFVTAVDTQDRAVLYPIAGGEPRPIPGIAAGELPVRWNDATSLFVVSRPGELPATISRLDLATGRRELWKRLTPLDPAGVFSIDPVLITPDGKAYVYSYRRMLSELYLVEGLR